jgi:hypothetical protein
MEPTVIYKRAKVKIKICPKCGSNYLKRHVDSYDRDNKSFVDLGYWHIYDQLEAGRYTCENGHYFKIKETIVVTAFEAYSEFEIE